MTFLEFTQSLQQLEETSSRLDMTELLAKLYLKLDKSEIRPASYLMLGGLVPPYKSLEFQLSNKMVIRALSRIKLVETNLNHSEQVQGAQHDLFGGDDSESLTTAITTEFKRSGDLGETAHNLLAENNGQNLTINQVFTELEKIAKFSGAGSQEEKVLGLAKLFEDLDPLSAKFVARIIIGKLRLGFSTMTMIDALSWAKHQDKTDAPMLERAYQKKADIGELAELYLQTSAEKVSSALEAYTVEAGIPFVPALCQRLNTSQEIIDKMGKVIVEPKYDGLRTQIHFSPSGIVAFTRNLEDVTHMYPELVEISTQLSCVSCILDAEAIGYDPNTGEFQPFQQTITRKRKHRVEQAADAVPLKFFVFDILELDGKSLINEPIEKRKEILRKLFKDSDQLEAAPFIVTTNPEEVKKFHNEQLAKGLEGAVMKKVGSKYVGGRKGWRWVKIKEEEGSSGKLSDTLDLIVMGYYFGKGKRTQFGVGAFLVGTPDDDSGKIKTIAKIGTGLTDDQFRELKKRCDQLMTNQKPNTYLVDKSLTPDVWTEPSLVVEIAADEITKSPTHSSGVALRFPRLLKFRDDKNWDQATKTSELKNITHLQATKS